jgi:hypothetical protein
MALVRSKCAHRPSDPRGATTSIGSHLEARRRIGFVESGDQVVEGPCRNGSRRDLGGAQVTHLEGLPVLVHVIHLGVEWGSGYEEAGSGTASIRAADVFGRGDD